MNVSQLHNSRALQEDAATHSTYGRAINKRVRVERACSNCRRLRRKCDAAIPCGPCKASDLQCSSRVSTEPTEKLTLARAVGKIAYLEDRLRVYESITRPTTEETRNRSDTPSTRQNIATQDDGMAQALRGLSKISLGARMPEFYGGSSSNFILNVLEDTIIQSPLLPHESAESTFEALSPENRAKLWLDGSAQLSFAKHTANSLPPRALTEMYVNRYFQTAHHIFPILGRKHFDATSENFWEGRPTEGQGYEIWTAVLCMVAALGHQYCLIDPDDEVRQRALSSPRDGERCFQLMKLSCSDVVFEGGDISVVNCLLLAFLWLYNQNRLHEAYNLLGMAVRTCYSIGLHRKFNIDSKNKAHVVGWSSSFWCMLVYEHELRAQLGRPCAIQAPEVDLAPFELEDSPIEQQYLERMRQFACVTWESWDQVYSLAFKKTRIAERARALQSMEQNFSNWLNGWFPGCTWANEPHGLVIRLRFTHSRLLLHRAFLHIFVQRCRSGKSEGIEELQRPAINCIQLALETTKLVVSSVHTAAHVSGTLQAILPHAVGYLWNALVTMLLVVSSSEAQVRLEPAVRMQGVLDAIDSALVMLKTYESTIPFARTAVRKSESMLQNSPFHNNLTDYGPRVAASPVGTTNSEQISDPAADWWPMQASVSEPNLEIGSDLQPLTEASYWPLDLSFLSHDRIIDATTFGSELDMDFFHTAAGE